MVLSFDRQKAKRDGETLGNNWPKCALSELRLICTQIKNIYLAQKLQQGYTIFETPLVKGIS